METIERLKLGDRLHFLDSLSEEELYALFRGAKLLLYPSFYEGFGFPPLLGLACGIPVIASNRGALPEILGEDVMYVDPDSIDSISRGMIQTLEDPRRTRQMAARGAAHASNYGWEEAARKTWEVYNRAVRLATPARLGV